MNDAKEQFYALVCDGLQKHCGRRLTYSRWLHRWCEVSWTLQLHGMRRP